MNSKLLTSAACFACAFPGADTADAAITIFAEYHLGEPLSLGTNNLPLDSVGGRDFTDSINPGGVTVGSPGAYSASTAYMDTSSATNSGYYALGNYTSLPNNNVAIGVFAKASAIAGNTGTIFGTGDGGGLDLSLAANGWAGSLFNVAWVGPADGAIGSFVADVWVHLALIRADGLTTFYIDGVPQGLSLATAPVNSSPHISVKPGGSAYFDGGIDEARAVTFDSGESTAAVLGALRGIPAETPWQSWQAAHFTVAERANPAISGPAADPEGDGLENLVEYATGTLPRNFNASPLVATPSGGLLTVRYTKNLNAPDVTLVLEQSTTLAAGSWIPVTATPTVISNVNQIVTLEVTLPFAGAPTKFARLLATQ